MSKFIYVCLLFLQLYFGESNSTEHNVTYNFNESAPFFLTKTFTNVHDLTLTFNLYLTEVSGPSQLLNVSYFESEDKYLAINVVKREPDGIVHLWYFGQELCRLDIFSNTTMVLKINKKVFFKCNNEKEQELKKHDIKEKLNIKQRQISITIMGDDNKIAGCISNITVNDSPQEWITPKHYKCVKYCDEHLCNTGRCIETYNTQSKCDCRLANSIGRFCNESLKIVQGRYTLHDYKIYPPLKVAWKSYSKVFNIMEILNRYISLKFVINDKSFSIISEEKCALTTNASYSTSDLIYSSIRLGDSYTFLLNLDKKMFDVKVYSNGNLSELANWNKTFLGKNDLEPFDLRIYNSVDCDVTMDIWKINNNDPYKSLIEVRHDTNSAVTLEVPMLPELSNENGLEKIYGSRNCSIKDGDNIIAILWKNNQNKMFSVIKIKGRHFNIRIYANEDANIITEIVKEKGNYASVTNGSFIFDYNQNAKHTLVLRFEDREVFCYYHNNITNKWIEESFSMDLKNANIDYLLIENHDSYSADMKIQSALSGTNFTMCNCTIIPSTLENQKKDKDWWRIVYIIIAVVEFLIIVVLVVIIFRKELYPLFQDAISRCRNSMRELYPLFQDAISRCRNSMRAIGATKDLQSLDEQEQSLNSS